MNGKPKKEKKTTDDGKPKRPMYDSMIHLWETSIDNNINDILGSYTGRPKEDEKPEQDADDL